MVNAQEYLDENYPKNQRNQIIKLHISNRDLEGSLELSDFVNLERLDCSYNKLVNLKITNCPNISYFGIWANKITSFDFTSLNPQTLTYLFICDNNFSRQDLSVFSKFVNLIDLDLGTNNKELVEKKIYNRFYGSLESLKDLEKLTNLDIRSTDIGSGLEFLPKSVKKIHCDSLIKNSLCWKIQEKLKTCAFQMNELSVYGYKYKSYDYQLWIKKFSARELLKDEFQAKNQQIQELTIQTNLLQQISLKKFQRKQLLSNLNPQNNPDISFWLNELTSTTKKPNNLQKTILENIQNKLLELGINQEQINELIELQQEISRLKRELQLEVG